METELLKQQRIKEINEQLQKIGMGTLVPPIELSKLKGNLVSERLHNELQLAFNMYFEYNSFLDDSVYYFQKRANMPAYASWLHRQLSHRTPDFSDQLQEFDDLRGDEFYRGVIAENPKFDSPIDYMKYALGFSLIIERQLRKIIDISIEEGDNSIEDFVRAFQVEKQAPFTHQIAKFLRALEDYDEDNIVASFNKDFESFITIDEI